MFHCGHEMHTRCIVVENKNQVQKRDPFFTRLCEVENDIIKMESFDPDQKGIYRIMTRLDVI